MNTDAREEDNMHKLYENSEHIEGSAELQSQQEHK
jgi:hypothetical protein